MKVLINNAIGGFNLSDEAVELCLERGMTWTGYSNEGIYEDESADFFEYTIYSNHFLWMGKYGIVKDDREFRVNPIVMAVVGEIGVEHASGYGCELHIVEIPFNSVEDWYMEIDDRGREWIVEEHRAWQ